jgi:hypothetical protein
MSIYKELLPYIDYIHSIRKLENYLSFDMKFPVKWVMIKSVMDESQIIPFEVGLENWKGLSFVSKIDESDIDLCLSRIQKVIKVNKEKETKEKLFKETVDRLKSTFEKTDLDKLQKLYFDFENDYDENSLEDDTEDATNLELAGQGEGKG